MHSFIYVKNEGERKIFIRLKEGRQACKIALKWSIYLYRTTFNIGHTYIHTFINYAIGIITLLMIIKLQTIIKNG